MLARNINDSELPLRGGSTLNGCTLQQRERHLQRAVDRGGFIKVHHGAGSSSLHCIRHLIAASGYSSGCSQALSTRFRASVEIAQGSYSTQRCFREVLVELCCYKA